MQAMTDTDTRWLVAILAGCCLLALLAGTCARERDAKRLSAHSLDIAETCVGKWQRQIEATRECLALLDDVRGADVACACWEAP